MTVEEIIQNAIQEDVGNGDHSSLASVGNFQGKMKLMAKEAGVIAGIEVAKEVLQQVDPAIQMKQNKNDGDEISNGDIIFTITGNAQKMLTAERTLLNFMQRMSGIATTTRKFVNLVEGTHVTLLDTRKTTPNMRIFEKEAVIIGGASNHRFGLYDMIMLKDNHIDFAGGIEEAIDKTHQYLTENHLDLKIEIETRTIEEVIRVVNHGGIDRIMLDNFSPEQIVNALKIIDGKYETEASGGITFSTLRSYAETGVDFISIGAFTHHINSLDMSLKFIEK